MDLIWTFKLGEPEEDVKVSVGKYESNLLELVIINGNNPFGNGTQKAVGIASFSDGKQLFCNYYFSRPTIDNPRMLVYTLYID